MNNHSYHSFLSYSLLNKNDKVKHHHKGAMTGNRINKESSCL